MIADLNGALGRRRRRRAQAAGICEGGGENGFGKVRAWNRTDLWSTGAPPGAPMSTNAWRSSASPRGSITARWRSRGSRSSRSTRSVGRRAHGKGRVSAGSARRASRHRPRERRSDHRQPDRRARRHHATTGDLHPPRSGEVCAPHSDGLPQFDAVMNAMQGSPELVRLGRDGRGEERWTAEKCLRSRSGFTARQRSWRNGAPPRPRCKRRAGLGAGGNAGSRPVAGAAPRLRPCH